MERKAHKTNENYVKNLSVSIWERAVLIHDVKNATPQPAGTLSEAGYFSLEKEVKNRR